MKPIDLNFKPSFILSAIIFLMAAMCCWIICLIEISLPLQTLSVALIGLAAIYVVIDALLMFPWSPARLHINAKSELHVIRKDGQMLGNLSLKNDSVVTPLLTIVHYKIQNTPWHQCLFSQRLVILPDSVEMEDFRQLRVWLLWGQQRKQR